jgi:hypothetical protein
MIILKSVEISKWHNLNSKIFPEKYAGFAKKGKYFCF